MAGEKADIESQLNVLKDDLKRAKEELEAAQVRFSLHLVCVIIYQTSGVRAEDFVLAVYTRCGSDDVSDR